MSALVFVPKVSVVVTQCGTSGGGSVGGRGGMGEGGVGSQDRSLLLAQLWP
jgi:hypothetical protein